MVYSTKLVADASSSLVACDLLEHTSKLMCPIVIFSGQINGSVLRQEHKLYIFQ